MLGWRIVEGALSDSGEIGISPEAYPGWDADSEEAESTLCGAFLEFLSNSWFGVYRAAAWKNQREGTGETRCRRSVDVCNSHFISKVDHQGAREGALKVGRCGSLLVF